VHFGAVNSCEDLSEILDSLWRAILSCAAHRPHIGLYIAILPPLGHDHSFTNTLIYTFATMSRPEGAAGVI